LLNRTLAAALRRPAAVAVAVSALLLLLAVPALGIKTGPPSASQLPTHNRARLDSELIARQIGPGWGAPFVLVAASDAGPIITAGDLRQLAIFQRRLSAQAGVSAVIGPGAVAHRKTRSPSSSAPICSPSTAARFGTAGS